MRPMPTASLATSTSYPVPGVLNSRAWPYQTKHKKKKRQADRNAHTEKNATNRSKFGSNYSYMHFALVVSLNKM